jgi:hypothetical protein
MNAWMLAMVACLVLGFSKPANTASALTALLLQTCRTQALPAAHAGKQPAASPRPRLSKLMCTRNMPFEGAARWLHGMTSAENYVDNRSEQMAKHSAAVLSPHVYVLCRTRVDLPVPAPTVLCALHLATRPAHA